jgi:hypothetical protein
MSRAISGTAAKGVAVPFRKATTITGSIKSDTPEDSTPVPDLSRGALRIVIARLPNEVDGTAPDRRRSRALIRVKNTLATCPQFY